MNILELIEDKKGPIFSFEFFPPRNEKAHNSLEKAIDKLKELNPDFVSVTFGAGGATRDGSYNLVKKLKGEKGLNVIPYFSSYGLGQEKITAILNGYKELDCDTIFAVRGDKPQDENFVADSDSFLHASDLISFIDNKYDFCLGAAGYPEGHNEAESKEKDLEYLLLKVKNGAKFIIAQYFYDNGYFFDFRDNCRKIGIDVPIIPGIMPIYSVKLTKNLAETCSASIPEKVKDTLATFDPEDNKSVAAYGIDFITDQCAELLREGVPGLHFYTINKANSVIEIINRLKGQSLI